MPKPKTNESKQDFLKRCTGELVQNEAKKPDQAYALCNLYWDNDQGQRSALAFTAPLEFQAGEKEGEARTFLITAKTSKPIDRGWGKLVIAVNGIKTKARIPILREHARDRVVGHSDKTWNDGKNFYASGRFSGHTPDAKEVLALADEGYPWQSSVYIQATKVMFLRRDSKPLSVNGEEVTGPADVWLESVVKEVSFVSLGADDETAAISMAGQIGPVEIQYPESINQGGTTMTQEEFNEQLQALMSTPDVNMVEALAAYGYVPKPTESQPLADTETETPDTEKIRTEATAAGRKEESARVNAILDLCALAGLGPKATTHLVKQENLSVEEARKKILELKADQSGKDEIRSTITSFSDDNSNPLLQDAKRRAEKAKR